MRGAIATALWVGGVAVAATVPASGEAFSFYIIGYSLLLWAGGTMLGLSARWSVALFGVLLLELVLALLLIPSGQSFMVLLGAGFYLVTAALLCGLSTIVRYQVRFDAFVTSFSLERRNQELASARLEAVEERAQKAAKDAFLERMSHELRTPLTAMLGYAELVHEEVEDAGMLGVVADIERVESAGHHLLDIISEILDLSAIEAGQVRFDPVEFDLGALVMETVDEVRPAAKTKGLVLTVDCMEVMVRHDAARLRQVMVALLSNAVRFTDVGNVRVAVENLADGVLVEVEDTGMGIPSKDLERVFASFQQADGSTTRMLGGSGLGLAVARGLVGTMGGEISVRSTEGEGSVFSIHLPTTHPMTSHEAVL